MAELAQFAVTFFLGYMAAKSARFWVHYAVAIFGVLAIPTLAVFFLAGGNSGLWDVMGSGMGLLLFGLLTGFAALFQYLPVMTVGMVLGAVVGGR